MSIEELRADEAERRAHQSIKEMTWGKLCEIFGELPVDNMMNLADACRLNDPEELGYCLLYQIKDYLTNEHMEKLAASGWTGDWREKDRRDE